ncbi:Ppc [Desulforapulum autotrophicum HRM2]|uniref:Phosphoenolpyruvate carboxylase n=2 Tax=Desulforapulum autotrophicum TaxID=2296 RepID=C0QB54_DESAH|nr:Ppc [Desulforapulum autotrophicum HRM2]
MTMNKPRRIQAFEKSVKNKFYVYNSLFLNLPFQKISNIGMLIPLLLHVCRNDLESGKAPLEILNSFFSDHTKIQSEREKIDFMFRVIQYVERQVVLYDSVEDSAFAQLRTHGNELSLKDYIHLSDNKRKRGVLSDKLDTFSIRIVFTAHPTQFYSPSVLDIIDNLRTLIAANNINEIDLALQQLGMTSLINARKPTPCDEAKNIIYFLKSVYYDAVGEMYSYIKRNVQNSVFDNPEIIQLGFWPGGDRDGNPFVTSEITMAVADELRMTLMGCYYREIEGLERKLTFRGVDDIITTLKTCVHDTMFDPTKTLTFEDIITPLYTIRDALVSTFNGLYLEDLDKLIDRVKLFRTHFAILDIRQNHAVHKQAIQEILKQKNRIEESLDELEKNELISILVHENFLVEADQFQDKIVKDTVQIISQIAAIQMKNGEKGCNRYIISNSEDIFSVLFVHGLFRWCCRDSGKIAVDIVPLFESMEGMVHAGTIMQELFDIPEYRSHVSQRRNRQTMMLGFSDGTKDGGYLQANWSIFKTKEHLSAVCDHNNVKAIFFDGRGGPPARGGGKTHRFYASQSQKISNHAIQLTIQGQTITSHYGSKAHFMHNCEQLLTAGLSNSLYEQRNAISNQSRQTLDTLARLSFEKYTALKNHKMFIPYLENKSTLKYYGETNIGSRPTRRTSKGKLELKDLRAIPFVGSWSQLKQNVPGYFGIGTSLKAFVDDGRLNELRQLFKDVPFFKALIFNSMMSLSKCNFALTGYIAEDPNYKEFWTLLFNEYTLSKQMVLLISDQSTLMEEEPVSKRSIEIREQIVLPLLIIQQYALQMIEQKSGYSGDYEKIVRRSLYGNINASRNSA